MIWDHLLAFKAEIIQTKLYFSFCAEQHTKNNYDLIMQTALFFLSFSFLARQGHFLSKSIKESSEKLFPFKV